MHTCTNKKESTDKEWLPLCARWQIMSNWASTSKVTDNNCQWWQLHIICYKYDIRSTWTHMYMCRGVIIQENQFGEPRKQKLQVWNISEHQNSLSPLHNYAMKLVHVYTQDTVFVFKYIIQVEYIHVCSSLIARVLHVYLHFPDEIAHQYNIHFHSQHPCRSPSVSQTTTRV